MPSLKIIRIEYPEDCSVPFLSDLLTKFKQYAAVPDDSRSALLTGLLKTALLKVQEYADRALLECTVELVDDIEENGAEMRLYMGGGEILSLTDSRGNAADYYRISGDSLNVFATGKVKCTYRTSPLQSDMDLCEATVLRYATALYDGEDKETLNSILNEVL